MRRAGDARSCRCFLADFSEPKRIDSRMGSQEVQDPRGNSMSSTSIDRSPDQVAASTRSALLPVLAIAAAVTLLHVLTNGRYGFHRDELQFLSDARHMDWGFVAYPPFTPLVERIGLSIFGLSLVGLRLFSVIAQATAVIVS